MSEFAQSGGFIQPLSPPDSTVSPTVKVLPQPRHTLLKHGSTKESNLFNYLDTSLEKIDGKVERRFENIGGIVETKIKSDIGYGSFRQAAADLDKVLDVIWVSGTPSIQIPFLLGVGNRVNEIMGRFNFSPQSLFSLLNKLDLAFASLMTGVDAESKQLLPNVNSTTMNVTEKVRLRGIVETARVAVVNASKKTNDSSEEYSSQAPDETTATDTDASGADDFGQFFVETDDQTDWDMAMSRVYERTLEALGSLEGGPVSNYAEMDTSY